MKSTRNYYKLVYICENDLSHQIGGTIHVNQILRSFRKMDLDFTLIAPRYGKQELMLPEGISVHLIRTPGIRILKWLYYYMASSLLLIGILLRHPRTVIYSREMPYNLFLPLIALLSDTPLLIELNGVFLNEMRELGYTQMTYTLSKFIEKLILLSAHRITCVSERIREDIFRLHALPKQKMVTVPNGTDPAIFYPLEKTSCRHELGLSPEDYIVGFIGSCYPYHDIPALLSAIPIVRQKIVQIRVLIVGDGYMLSHWKQQAERLGIAKRTTFTGYVPFHLANQYINAFDICFASYRANTSVFPMKILDYLACDKAILTADIPTINRYFDASDHFRLVQPGNIDQITDSIYDLYRIRNRKIGKHRQIVLHNFTWHHTAERIKELIESSTRGAL